MSNEEAIAELGDVVRMLCAFAAQHENAALARTMSDRCDAVIDAMRLRFPA